MAKSWSDFPLRLARGRPQKHGAYSIISKGRLPKNRRRVQIYLQEVRAGLIQDLGPTPADLTTAQKILIDRVVQKLAIMRCIEEWADVHGLFEENNLIPPIKDFYLSCSNSLRLDLQALGIGARKSEQIVDLGKYIEEKYSEGGKDGPK